MGDSIIAVALLTHAENMKSRVWLLLLLWAVISPLSVDATDKSAEALIKKSQEISAIQEEGSPPFVLLGHFTVSYLPDRPVGNYTLYWAGKSRWRSEIVSPGFSEIRVFADSKLWTDRNLSFRPLFMQFLRYLQLPLNGSDLRPRDISHRKLNGVKVTCVRFETKGDFLLEDCFDATSATLLEHRAGNSSSFYSDYAAFGQKNVARSIKVTKNGIPLLESHIDEIKSKAMAPSLFQPLTSGVQPWCESPQPPKPKKTAGPTYLEITSESWPGETVLFTHLGVDGATNNTAVVQSARSDVDSDAVEAVKKWTFEPAKCGSEPVPFELFLEFRRGRR